MNNIQVQFNQDSTFIELKGQNIAPANTVKTWSTQQLDEWAESNTLGIVRNTCWKLFSAIEVKGTNGQVYYVEKSKIKSGMRSQGVDKDPAGTFKKIIANMKGVVPIAQVRAEAVKRQDVGNQAAKTRPAAAQDATQDEINEIVYMLDKIDEKFEITPQEYSELTRKLRITGKSIVSTDAFNYTTVQELWRSIPGECSKLRAAIETWYKNQEADAEELKAQRKAEETSQTPQKRPQTPNTKNTRALKPWRTLAKLQKKSDLLPPALVPQRDFLSTLLGQPIEETCSKRQSEKMRLKTIKTKVENKLDGLEQTVGRLENQCAQDSLTRVLYEKTRNTLHERIVALKRIQDIVDWSHELSSIRPLIETCESISSTGTAPIFYREALQELWKEVGDFWQKTKENNDSKWSFWKRVTIPENIETTISEGKALQDGQQNYEALQKAIAAAEQAGMKIGSKVEELKQFKEAPRSVIQKPQVASLSSFDLSFNELSAQLQLNIQGSETLRGAINQKFTDTATLVSLQPLFRSRGTVHWELLATMKENLDTASANIRKGKLSPLEEKKALYQMMLILYECTLLEKSTQSPCSREAHLAKTILLLRTVVEMTSQFSMSRTVYPEDLYSLFPLSKTPPHLIDRGEFENWTQKNTKKVSALVLSSLNTLRFAHTAWTRDHCTKMFTRKVQQLVEDGKAAREEVEISLMELQLSERQKSVQKGSLEESLVESTLAAIQKVHLPYDLDEKNALDAIFSLSDMRAQVLQQGEAILRKDPRMYGKLLFEKLIEKHSIDQGQIPNIDFQTQDRSFILQQCRKCLQEKVQPQEMLELEKMLRRITKIT